MPQFPLCVVWDCSGTVGFVNACGAPRQRALWEHKLLLGDAGSFASFFRLTQSCYFTAVTVTAMAPVPNLSKFDGCDDSDGTQKTA